MSIQTAIENAQQRVADCYTAISNKGGTLPQTQNLANMPTAIGSISAGGTIDSLSITPMTSKQTITASGGVDGYSPITVNAVTSSIDSNIQAENIKNGVSILGVRGTYTGGGGSSTKYGATIDNLLGDVNASGVLQPPSSGLGSLTFTGVNDIASNALSYRFYKNDSIGSVTFPDLKTVSGNYCMDHAFDLSSITSISFPELLTIRATYAMEYLCRDCPNLQYIDFSKLKTISAQNALTACFFYSSGITSCSFPELQTISGGSALRSSFSNSAIVTMSFPKLSILTGAACLNGCFSGCKLITDIYFNALTTTSFGTKYINQLNNMFNNNTSSGTAATSGNVNVHFPSNLETTISGLTGYPLFGGHSGRVTLLFDLPATS